MVTRECRVPWIGISLYWNSWGLRKPSRMRIWTNFAGWSAKFHKSLATLTK